MSEGPALRRWLAPRWSLLSPGVLVLVVVALVAAVLNAEGYRTPKLELHDAGVWISWEKDGAIGRTNTQLSEVDVRLDANMGDFDLLQSDAYVMLHDRVGDAVVQVDGRTAGRSAPVALPKGSVVDLGGSPAGLSVPTMAVLEPGAGRLWALPADELGSTSFGVDAAPNAPGTDVSTPVADAVAAVEPSATLEGAQDLVVGSDGVAWAYAPKSGELLGVAGTGEPVESPPVDPVEDPERAQVSAVGATPVALDQDEGRVLVPGEAPIDISQLGDNPQLQLPGPTNDVVYVATDSSLGSVSLTDGVVTPLSEAGTGLAARPVFLRGCAWSAWGGDPRYARACLGAEPFDEPIPGVTGGTELRFRTNRGQLVINELETGKSAVLLDDAPAEKVDWSQAHLETEEEPDPNAEETSSDERRQDPDQKPPVAVDDTGSAGFGTRPDRSVVVDILRNDTDPNDDVLVIDAPVLDVTPAGAQVEIVGGGRAVQVTPAPGSSDTVSFSYTINDGYATCEKPARVEVDVRGANENGRPELRKPSTTTVVVGRSVTHNVLADAFDPDGDALAIVVPVVLDPSQGTLTAAVDGTIVYTAPGEGFQGGPVKIPFTITDGMGQPNSELAADLEVTVLATPGNAPVARQDHAQTVVGREVVVDVLANDSDADGDHLRVLPVTPQDGVTITVDDQQRVHVTPARVDTFNLDYSITDGGKPVVGKLRVDVLAPVGTGPPVAVRDDVVLRPGVAAVVDVLANDIDPNGDVLVVQSVDVGTTGLAVEIREHRYLRINVSDGQPLLTAVAVSYVVTDGTNEDTGIVVVRPGPATSQDQPPTALDDQFTVHAGNVAALDVLGNDTDPEGGKLTIELAELPPDLADMFFVQGGLLRYVAPTAVPLPPSPPSVRVVYSAVDPSGASESATVDISIVGPDPNAGPRPPDLTARTVAGREVKILVPVASMDPEGDDVTLLGVGEPPLAKPPGHGAVTEVGMDYLMYRPDLSADGFWGTDEFTYQVRDSQGALATATVRVGVGKPPTVNSPPVAIDDVRQVVEGGALTIQVTRNDSDPDDDDDDDGLQLVAASVTTPPGVSWSAVADAQGAVAFDAAGLKEGAQAAFSYEVTDGILTDTGVVQVKVVSRAENLAPVAVDDRTRPATAGDVVGIDVLANDHDPDGSPEKDDLVVTVPAGSGATVVGNVVRLTMPTHDAAVVYTLTDAANGVAKAVARVRLVTDSSFPPVAVYDKGTTKQDTPVTVPVLGNDEVSTGTKELERVDSRPGGTCTLTADGQVRFTPTSGFWGASGCTYVLRDGPGDVLTTRRAIGMVGIVVKRAANTPPTFIEQRITIAAGAERVVGDLRVAVRDPDDGDLERIEFTDVQGEASGVTGRFGDDGHRFTMAVRDDAPGGEVVLTFTVSDTKDSTVGTVSVLVIPRPPGPEPEQQDDPGLPAVLLPDVAGTVQGKPITIDVLRNDQPAENGAPLTIVGVSAVSGGTADVKGSAIEFRPAADFHGETRFSYTVNDGTGAPRSANVTVTVVGFPDAPAAPSVVRESGAITLSWGVPAHNGAPITEYWVRATGGTGSGVRKDIHTNTYRFDGLQNDVEYRFEIAAVNRAVTASGSEPRYGPLSPPIKPDAVKLAPATPTATFDEVGETIDVVWIEPGGDGSKVTGYKLEVSPPPTAGSPAPLPGSQLFYRATGLTNGTPYTFRVQAINDAGPSPWSPWSTPETPAKPPDAPLAPSIASEGDGEIIISWQPPARDNGDPIRSYELRILRNGAESGTAGIDDPGATQKTITTDNGESFTFQVRADNKAGFSEWSAPSAPGSSFGVPKGVTSVQATEGDTSSEVTASEPDPNGRPIIGYRYAINGGGWVEVGSSPSFTVNGLTNGTPYTFQVQAQNERGWSDDAGVASSAVRPYGKPSAPAGLTGSNNNSKHLTWTWGAPSLNGHDSILGYEVSVNGGGWQPASSGFAIDVPNYNDCRDVRVRAIGNRTSADNRQIGAESGAVQVCSVNPPPSVTTSRGTSAVGRPGCSSAGCSYLVVSWQNLPAGAHSYECVAVNGGVFNSGGGLSGESGSIQLPCYADASVYGGVYVRIDGTYSSDVATW